MGIRMEAIIVGVVGAFSALVVQVVGYYFNKKTGLNEAQEAYQDTLEGMNRALGTRVTDLEKIVEELNKKNELLEAEVHELRKEVRELTRENLDLMRKLVDRKEV